MGFVRGNGMHLPASRVPDFSPAVPSPSASHSVVVEDPGQCQEVSAVQMGLPASSTTDRCPARAEASRSWSDANPIVLHHIRIDDLVIQGGKWCAAERRLRGSLCNRRFPATRSRNRVTGVFNACSIVGVPATRCHSGKRDCMPSTQTTTPPISLFLTDCHQVRRRSGTFPPRHLEVGQLHPRKDESDWTSDM